MSKTTLSTLKTSISSQADQTKRRSKSRTIAESTLPSSASISYEKMEKTRIQENSSYFQITCEQADLSHHLGLVSHVVSAKPTVAILGNVLIMADKETQQVHLTVLDLSLGIRTNFSARVVASGEITIPVELLNSIVSKLPTGQITLSNFPAKSKSNTKNKAQEEQEETLITTLVTESGRYQFMGISADDFPALEPGNLSIPTYQLSPETLVEGLKGSLFAVSKDETKRIISGVNIKLESSHITFAATDGHRLALVEASIPKTGIKNSKKVTETEALSFTVPNKTLTELLRIITASNYPSKAVELRYEKESNTLNIYWEKVYLFSRCLEGDYPPYHDMLSIEHTQTVTFEKASLLKALERLNTLLDSKEKTVIINIEASTQKLLLSVEREFGKGKEEITAVAEPESDLQMAFNIKYLLEGVKSISAEQIRLNITHSLGPCTLTPFGNKNKPNQLLETKYLLMPVQINN